MPKQVGQSNSGRQLINPQVSMEGTVVPNQFSHCPHHPSEQPTTGREHILKILRGGSHCFTVFLEQQQTKSSARQRTFYSHLTQVQNDLQAKQRALQFYKRRADPNIYRTKQQGKEAEW